MLDRRLLADLLHDCKGSVRGALRDGGEAAALQERRASCCHASTSAAADLRSIGQTLGRWRAGVRPRECRAAFRPFSTALRQGAGLRQLINAPSRAFHSSILIYTA